MKLLHRTIVFMSGALLVALTIWAVIFYVNMLDEVHDSIDDGLDNSRLLIINEARKDSTVLDQLHFEEGNYAIQHLGTKQHIKDVFKDTLMFMENEHELEPVRLLTTTFTAENGQNYRLKVISSMVEEDDLVEDFFYSLLWLYIILIVTILGINYLVLRSMWKPFFTFLGRIRQFKLGKNEKIDPVKSKISEFQMLNEVVMEVLENNVRSFHSQKQLIENTSHEIQTPLAIALNKLELLAEQQHLSEEAVGEIYQVAETLQRLSRLNQSLQLLSKIENHQFPDTERINLNELIQSILLDFEDQIRFREIQLAVYEYQNVIVDMHPDLARILFSNLIRNAIRHNVKGGTIAVIFEMNQVIVSNSGASEQLDEQLVFTRFYKQSNNSGSSGLGLAIIRSIADVSNAKVEYSFNGLHQFRVWFPAEDR